MTKHNRTKELLYFFGGSAVVAGVVLYYLRTRENHLMAKEDAGSRSPVGFVFEEDRGGLAEGQVALFLSHDGAWRVTASGWRKLTDDAFGAVGKYTPETYDFITSRSKEARPYSWCSQCLKLLKRGGKMVAQGPQGEADNLSQSAMFAGFERLSTKIFLDQRVYASGLAAVTGYAPKETMKAGKLNLRKKKRAKTVPKADVKKIWSLAADDLDGGELEDEDALLDNETEPVEIKQTKFDDCEVGKKQGRKPCANCHCGRKEEWEAGPDKEAKDAPASACGSCHLGDAFRCAGCPSLGKPAYNPDKEKVTMDQDGAWKLVGIEEDL